MKKIITLYTVFFLVSFFNCLEVKAQTVVNLDALEWLPKNDRVISGAILVPENHGNPNGKKIQISYVVIKASVTLSKNYPMIFFSGGPGGNTINEGAVEFLLQHPFTENRDLILFDQRGIGYSSNLPNMAYDSFNIMAQDANETEEFELTSKMINDYQKKCRALNIDPSYYNTNQNAQDIGMLFKHLGYEKYNLYGSSYGTRLARVVQDKFPEYVNSSLLDSPDPLSGDFLLDRLDSYSKALNKIFDYCDSTPNCKNKYPNLKSEYFNGIVKLKSSPIKTTINDSIDFYINAQDGIYLLRRLLYRGDSREKSPELIRAFNKGEGQIINEIVQFEHMFTGILNLTMLLSVEKHENFTPNITPEEIKETYTNYPLVTVKMGFFDAFYQAGNNWHNNIMPIEDRKFEDSKLPTLIFVNKFDPVTPPENGHLFMKNLSKGTLLILNEGGHGSGNPECKDQVMINFMNDPNKTLDTSCLKLVEN